MGCLKWSHFLLDHPQPELFFTSQWQPNPNKVSPLYLVYRAAMALSLVGLLGGYIASLDYDKSLFFIYLTHWGFCLIVLFHVIDFFYLGNEMYQQTRSDYEEPDRLNYLGKLSWLICNVASAAAPFITAFYWIVLYDPASGDTASFWNVLVHGLNSVFVYLELFITARPWRLQHFYQPIVLGLIYVAFTLIYYVAGGEGKEGQSYIYKVLDWENDAGEAVLYSFIAITAVTGAHFNNCLLAWLREALGEKCLGETRNRRSNRVSPMNGDTEMEYQRRY